MTGQYAMQQPQGYFNYVKTVAIVGAGGQIGKFFTDYLLKTRKHLVTAITRDGNHSAFPERVRVATVNYKDEDSVVSALKGQDFLIITMSLTAAPDTHSKLVKAAAKAGVPYVMPNAHSINFTDSESLRRDIPIGETVLERIAEVKQLGMTCIPLIVGFWYEYSLIMGINTFGFSLEDRKVTLYDDGKKAINTSTWEQCGRAVAALLSLKRLPEDENDKSVAISHFQDRPLFVSSFEVSQRDVLESVKRVTGTGDKDWQVTCKSADVCYREGMQEVSQGNQLGFYKAMYARVFNASGDADFETDNKLLGLPEEDIDEATKRALRMAKET